MKQLLPILSILLSLSAIGQITVTSADYGSAGDSLVTATDVTTTGVSVGGTGMQTWNYANLAVNDINTLKFENPVNTSSGSAFGGSDIAIERQDDTLFFILNATELTIDGIAGDAFNLGASLQADFNPNATQITFPSTFNTSFMDTAVFDTVVSCAVVGQGGLCDSAHLMRRVIITSEIDAYGTITTPGGTYTALRQYYREDNHDSLAILIPLINQWQTIVDSTATVHNYRWVANGEDWPVLTAIADAQDGDIIEATFKIDDNLIGAVQSDNDPACNGDCTGSITVGGLGGTPPYSFNWSDGQTSETASSLCAGTYTVTITDAAVGADTLTITLSEPSAISITGAVQGVSIGADGAIQPSVSGGAGDYTYSWSGPDGYTATTKNIASLDEGTYTVTVTDANGCEEEQTFDVMLTGIKNISSSDVRIYPNPASETLTIEAASAVDQLVVFNLLGTPVVQMNNVQSTNRLDVSQLAPGIYTIVVTSNGSEFYSRVTIER